MPRASHYLLEGYTYHLTHRCHEGQFLLKSRTDRHDYRKWLMEGVSRFKVPVYAYCITRNHVHVVAHACSREAISGLMHLASGSVAKRYNLRHERENSMWEHPYHCTVIQDGKHLANCLRYVDLNMVRAGVVSHPREWPQCGYDELVGRRQRYRVLDVEGLAERVGAESVKELHDWYADSVEERLAAGGCQREAHWTESLAVGDRQFVESMPSQYRQRMEFVTSQAIDNTWYVREERDGYSTEIGA